LFSATPGTMQSSALTLESLNSSSSNNAIARRSPKEANQAKWSYHWIWN